MNNEGTVINKCTIMNPQLCQINNIKINNVNIYNQRFENYETLCNWKLVFDKDFSIDVKSKVMHRISVLSHNLEKYLKIKLIIIKDKD